MSVVIGDFGGHVDIRFQRSEARNSDIDAFRFEEGIIGQGDMQGIGHMDSDIAV